MRRLALCASVLASTLMPASGHASSALAVLPIIIEGDAGKVTLSTVLSDVSAATELRVGLRLISAEEMFVASSGGLARRVRDCGSDTVCIANKLRRFDARLGLVVVVNLALDPALVSLQLLDTDARTMVGQSVGELEASQTLSSAIRARASEVFEAAGYSRAGRLIVDVTPGAAKVKVSGESKPDKGKGNVFTIKPGRYEVEAELSGYISAKTAAVVTGGDETRVAMVLEKSDNLVEKWWFWTAIGAVVAGGATAAIVATQPTTRCVCTTIDGRGCQLCN